VVSGQHHAQATLPREKPGAPCIGGWQGPRARLDAVEKSLVPAGNGTPAIQSIARYTAWANPAIKDTTYGN
jgi:hypothetical protein